MQRKLLLLVPVLVLITACGEKIEAQESEAAPAEVSAPSDDMAEKADPPEEKEVDLRLRTPVGID